MFCVLWKKEMGESHKNTRWSSDLLGSKCAITQILSQQFYNPDIHDMWTHIALLVFEMDDNSTIFKVYDFFFFFFFFFFSIETTRRSVGFLLIVENDFTDCCDPIFGAREMSNVFHKQDLNIGDKLNCT